MDKEALRRQLMGTFLGELEEHVQALNRDLLALEKDPSDRAELIVSLFRTAHSLKGAARSVRIPSIEAACHRLESLLGPVRDGQRSLEPETIQLLYSAADAFKDAGTRLRSEQDPATGSLQTLLHALGDAAPQSSTSAAPKSRAARAKALTAVASAASAADHTSAPAAPEGFMRVPTEKLDALLTASGELLVARRRVTTRQDDVVQLLNDIRQWHSEWRQIGAPLQKLLALPGSPKRTRLALERQSERIKGLEHRVETLSGQMAAEHRVLERAATSLEEEIRRVRLFPFQHACEGLERAIRDLARASGKQVELISEGGHVELDRFVLESLKDPLLHLVRNAVDHGVETPDARRAAGKPPEGRITISATLRSGAVEIVVADDGQGLDMAAIRKQAHRKQLQAPSDDREAARLAFLPGFSTARLVTELSGRGMGLDVVKHRVEALHGQVDMSFAPGAGTRVALIVPLTLTTIRALLVKAAGHVFAVPVAHVSRLLRAGAGDLASAGGREVLLSDGAPIPVVSLADVLAIENTSPYYPGSRAPLIVVSSGRKQIALVVDELLAEDEILVKSLGARLRRVRHLSGATILPSGRVALILNTADLVSSAAAHAPRRTVAAALSDAQPETRRRLLLAEDSVTTRSLEKSILEAAGYEVLTAADGSDAWRLLQERGADLVVADVEMPRLDGFALCEAIRRSSRFRELPVVLVTALESDKDKARGLEVGADAYLPKSSFDQRQLIKTIAQLL